MFITFIQCLSRATGGTRVSRATGGVLVTHSFILYFTYRLNNRTAKYA